MKKLLKTNPYVLGLCTVPVGILLGLTVNKWLGIGVIALATILTIVCIQQKRN